MAYVPSKLGYAKKADLKELIILFVVMYNFYNVQKCSGGSLIITHF